MLAALQLPGHIQTWLLYHNALSTNVVVSDILRYARKTKESGSGEANEDLVEQVAELRKLVQKQEQLLASAGLATQGVVDPRREPERSSGRAYGRAFSMSGMDVWGDMALGDLGDLAKSQLSTGPGPTSQSERNASGFSFSQPDTMPPR